MRNIPVVLLGFGRVGQAFVRLAEEKKENLKSRHGLLLSIQSVIRKGRGVLIEEGALKDSLLREAQDIPSGEELWRSDIGLKEALQALSRGVLVICLSSDIRTGEPGLSAAREALRSGWHVVTADKGPLMAAMKELRSEARKRKLSLKYSGAAGAALPTLDVALRCLVGAEVLSVEGILNGTSNYILTRMQEGLAYDTALAEAQEKGIAEPDPGRDVEGWDTAVKLLLIVNSALDTSFVLDDVRVRGITDIGRDRILAARAAGKKVKLVGTFEKTGNGEFLEVRVKDIDGKHPLFTVDGTEKGVTFLTDSMGRISVTGGKSDPKGAAAALLKDVISIYAA